MRPSAPYIKSRATSKQAAYAIDEHLNPLQELLIGILTAAGKRGLTDYDMQERSDLRDCTQTPRRIELVRKGMVVNSGRKRKTGSGRRAIVWVLKQHAPESATYEPLKRCLDPQELRDENTVLKARVNKLRRIAKKWRRRALRAEDAL